MTRGEQKAKQAKEIRRDKFVLFLIFMSVFTYYLGTPTYNLLKSGYNGISNVVQIVSFKYGGFNDEQIKNIKVMQKASLEMNHPNATRMVAHLLVESNAKMVKDGDKGNGFGKKSYGMSQVKLGTVYYNKTKRQDLFDKYAPEVNTLPKEDVLHKLRTDAEFNAKMGVITSLVLIDICKTLDRATVAYNRGRCDADALGTKYFNKILESEARI